MNEEWIEWKGGKRRVSGDTKVRVLLSNEATDVGRADSFRWSENEVEFHVVAYCVVQETTKADDGWIEWTGGYLPVLVGSLVEVRMRCGETGEDFAELWQWNHDGGEADIVAYRVVQDATKAEDDRVFTASSSESVVTVKPSNPKDIVGVRKAPMSTVSAPVLAEIGVGMLEGAAKYGRHNYRIVGVRSSVYYDATMRHLMSWWEGEDIDPESGMSHITKAITSLVVLRDSQIQGTVTDDRAPRSVEFYGTLNKLAGEIIDRHADKSPRHYTIADEVSK